jgi:hypothetical protein
MRRLPPSPFGTYECEMNQMIQVYSGIVGKAGRKSQDRLTIK